MKPSEINSRELIEPKWIVKDMLPRGTMIVLAGEAGAGKSYLMYNLAYAVAAGKSFLGHPTTPTRILYFDEENAEPDFLQYNQWAWAAMGCPPLVDQVDPWLQVEHYALLTAWKEPMARLVKEFKPGLVIIDTATPALHIQDENDNSEASRAIQTLRQIREVAGDPDLTFIILKHERQRDEAGHRRTIRGAKVWLGAVDQVLYHVIAPGAKRRKDGTRKTRLEPDKLRAFALDHIITIDPIKVKGHPTSLILQASRLEDVVEVEED
jgi:RecA-family ATPase